MCTTEQRAFAKFYDNFSAMKRILDKNLSLIKVIER